ncbi:amino acid/polyamine permease family protein [Skeletonema marinoi]|uniref:Amino acid/polyamine permease family protein n=1 Tax=Skeletonema marinoi TaxID=267567 RepID=A0AAD8XY59_9STRA|nr:amino acid/polyamine permease family protein [Skeletonema marinoi]
MINYSTFDGPNNRENDQKDPLPNLYASPRVSSALITAFGLPTLVEYEAPSSANTGSTKEPPSSPQFTRINNSIRRLHSKSLPAENIPFLHQPSTKSPLRSHNNNHRRLSQSAILQRTTASDDSSSNNKVAYTYRVRASTFGDEHHLLMVQNEDGSYSHANVVDGEPFTNDTYDDNNDNCLDETSFQNETGAGIVPLQLLTETNNTMNEDGHVPLPSQLLHPQYTSTTPALKLWPLAILVFYNVSGGPFGIEPSIRAAGNFYAIVGFCIFPFIWSLPEALVTAELGSTFQDPSAGVAWVEEAFGEEMGRLCGYLGWVSGATDNAIYPTLFLEYVTSVVGWDKDEFGGWTRFGLVALITICLSLLNYTGLEIVGKASLLVCVIAMSPFVLMTIIGAPHVVPSRWLQMPEVPEDGTDLFDDDFQTSPGPLPLLGFAGILWRPFMNNMFWNLNSFDNAASFAGETTDVKKTYPRGIFIGLIMTVVFYIVPLMVAVGATDYTQSEWVDGHLGAVAVDIGGSWLGAWTIFAAGISNLALFEAELSADAFQLMGMAERGYLPKIFQKRSRYGTPTTGIIVGTMVIIMFGCADFGQLLELLNANYAVSLLMEYAAFIKLRLFRKELERPYRIPLPDWAAVLIAVPPCLATIAIILISNWYVYIFTFGAIICGIFFFKVGDIAKRKGWFEYVKTRGYAMPPMDDSSSGVETFDPLSSDVVNHEGEWEYREDNRIT